MHPLAEEIIEFYGGFTPYEKLSADYIGAWRGKLPESFLEFWQHYGLGSLAQGSFWFCKPERFVDVVESIFTGDKEIDPAKCHVFGYSAFGELYIWSEEHWTIQADLLYNTVSVSNLDKPEHKKMANFERSIWASISFRGDKKPYLNDTYDNKEKPLYLRAKKKLGALEPGQCYGFFPALAMGGQPVLESLQRVDAEVHFSFLAELETFRLINFLEWPAKFIRNIGE